MASTLTSLCNGQHTGVDQAFMVGKFDGRAERGGGRALPDDRIVVPGSGQHKIVGPRICGRSRTARDATYL
jgi:hypothetical protein